MDHPIAPRISTSSIRDLHPKQGSRVTSPYLAIHHKWFQTAGVLKGEKLYENFDMKKKISKWALFVGEKAIWCERCDIEVA